MNKYLVKDLPEFVISMIEDCHKLHKTDRIEIDELVKRISETTVLNLKDLKGKEKWINQTISPENGLLVIDAKAKGDLRVTFAESNSCVLKNSSTPCYNFVIGGHLNNISYLRRRNESQSTKLSTSNVVCDENISQTYWFNLNFKEKTISCGKGDPNLEKTFLKWKDTNFLYKVKYIGLSNYNIPIEISNIQIKKTLKSFDLNLNEGYLFKCSDLNSESNYVLSKLFISDYLNLNVNLFSFEKNCYYLQNNCFIKMRQDHLYLRPSNCSKFVFKDENVKVDWLNSYQGTHPENVKRIIEFGLKSEGDEIFTSKIPLYAEMNAPTVYWKDKYIQTIFIFRQDPKKVQKSKEIQSNTFISAVDIQKLYNDRISKEDVELVTLDEKSIDLHALLIKIHDVDPFDSDSEYSKLKEIIESKKIK
jgi:hypothetical protein